MADPRLERAFQLLPAWLRMAFERQAQVRGISAVDVYAQSVEGKTELARIQSVEAGLTANPATNLDLGGGTNQGRPPVGETPQLHLGTPGVSKGPSALDLTNRGGGATTQPQSTPQPRTITVGGQPVELPPPPQQPPPGSPPEVLKQYENDVADYKHLIFSIQLDAAQKAAERTGNLEDKLKFARIQEELADLFRAEAERRGEGRTIAAEDRAQEEARKVRAETLASEIDLLGRKYGFEIDAQAKQQLFQAGESALERKLRLDLQQQQITAQTQESEADRQLRLRLQQEQIGAVAGESALERQVRLTIQERDLAAQTQEAAADRQFRQMLQEQQGTLQKELINLQQTFQGTEAEKNRVIERQRVALEHLSITEATLARKEKLELDRQSLSVQKKMAAYDTVMKMVQNPLTFAIYRQAGGLFSSLGSEFAGIDAIPVPTETTEQNLARWQARSQFSKEGPGIQGAPTQPSTVLPTGAAVQPLSAPLTREAPAQVRQPTFQPQGQQPTAATQPTTAPQPVSAPAPVFQPQAQPINMQQGIALNPGEQIVGNARSSPGVFGAGLETSTALPNQVFTVQGAQGQREVTMSGFNTLIGPYILPTGDLALSAEELASKYPKVSAAQWREAVRHD